jgi:Ni,Fe-hydrogenase I cytochrome b subunit
MWVLIVFTLIHVYMVAWYSIRGRSMVMEAMISGYKVDDAQPQK